MEKFDFILIGGSLSGVCTAFLLAQKHKSFVLLEARSRLGGRIICLSIRAFFADPGPSWYWPRINPKATEALKIYP